MIRRVAWLLPLALACSRQAEPAASAAPTASAIGVERAAPAGPAEPIVVTDAEQVPALVGKLVTLVGKQTRTKQPTVLGVDVDEDYSLADETVRVTGIVRRWVVERDPNEGVPPEEMIATRGAGTYYSIVDPETGRLAKPVKAR